MNAPRRNLAAPGSGEREANSTPAPRRETVVVTPDQVWSAPREGSSPAAPAAPARQSFFAPIALVVALSTALMAVTLAALLLVLLVRR